MNKPTGDEPSSSTSKSLPQQTSRQQELFALSDTIGAATVGARNARPRILFEHTLAVHRQRNAERVVREAARDAEIAQLQSEVAKLRAANQHLQKENDSMREEVIHHRYAVGLLEEENGELRDRLEMPKVASRLDYN